MSIDLSKVNAESPGFQAPLPNAAYQVRIVEVKRHGVGLYVTFAVVAGDFKGRTIKHRFALDYDFGKAHLKCLCEAISSNGKAPDTLEEQHFEHMKGKELVIRTLIEKNESGSYPRIQDFLADSRENFERAADDARNGPEFFQKKPKQDGSNAPASGGFKAEDDVPF